MPLLDSDTTTLATDMEDGGYRPRSGSGGLRNFFRKKHKSGDPEGKHHNNYATGHSVSPTSPTAAAAAAPGASSKPNKKHPILDGLRPRSRTDVTHGASGLRPRTQSMDVPADYYTSGGPGRHHARGDSAGGRSAHGTTPMSALLTEGGRAQSGGQAQQPEGTVTPEMFVEMYRYRAYSDPKPRSTLRAAAMAARSKKVRPKNPTLLVLWITLKTLMFLIMHVFFLQIILSLFTGSNITNVVITTSPVELKWCICIQETRIIMFFVPQLHKRSLFSGFAKARARNIFYFFQPVQSLFSCIL